jgi:hypothetical protein
VRAAGYDALNAPVTVPVNAAAPLDAALTRDWAAAPGGARIRATNDDTGRAAGCGAAAAVDQSQGVGWSALNLLNVPSPSRRRTPALTLELPQAITIERFGMDPGATCGDGASATTKAYTLETSPDGMTWTVAADGAFDAADRGRLVPVVPRAGATNVRFVRLTLRSPQSAAAGTSGARFIDFSELTVYGRPANVLPTGSLGAAPATTAVGRPVALDASSFADPDSAITGYAWDLDGDGAPDRTTATPTTAVVFATPGRHAVSVAVADFRGGAGVASATVLVTPGPVGPASGRARPSLVLPRTAGRGRVRMTVTCRDPCRLSATLTVSAALRRRHGLATRTVGRLAPRTIRGRRTITVTLSSAALRRLRARHVRSLTVTLRVTAAVSGNGPRRTVSRTVKIALRGA